MDTKFIEKAFATALVAQGMAAVGCISCGILFAVVEGQAKEIRIIKQQLSKKD